MELGDGDVAERLDRLVLQRRRQRVEGDVAQRRERHRADDGLGAMAAAVAAGDGGAVRARLDGDHAPALQQVALEAPRHRDGQVLVAVLEHADEQVLRGCAAVHRLPVVGEGLLQQRDVARRGAVGDVGVVAEVDLRVRRAVGGQEIVHGDVVLRVGRVVPVLEVAERQMLPEHRIAPGPGRQLARLAAERVARVRRPIGELDVFAAEEELLAGAVLHEPRRDVHDLDAVALGGGDGAAVGARDAVAARLRMARQVEQRVEAAADALAPLEQPHLEPVLFERERGLEAGEARADDDDIGVARAGGAQAGREAGERCGGGGVRDELAACDAHGRILRRLIIVDGRTAVCVR